MNEVTMDITWRTVQFFLEPTGVVEVGIDSENPQRVRCDCPAFNKSARCKHTRWTRNLIEEQGGYYPLVIPSDLDMDEVASVVNSPERFRDFVIKYNKVRVIA